MLVQVLVILGAHTVIFGSLSIRKDFSILHFGRCRNEIISLHPHFIIPLVLYNLILKTQRIIYHLPQNLYRTTRVLWRIRYH